jgi:aspartyl-tRNA(Asn)/glutamyl-tRNA(Gln) amidotransferase subunit C
MSITVEELDNLSTLARITIAPEEKEKMLADVQAILGYISEINEVQGELTRGEESVYNVVREDVITHPTGSNTDAILADAPSVKDGYVKVEQVLK